MSRWKRLLREPHEGTGNVICLDVIRAIQREPATIEAFANELRKAKGEPALDQAIDEITGLLHRLPTEEGIAAMLSSEWPMRFKPAFCSDSRQETSQRLSASRDLEITGAATMARSSMGHVHLAELSSRPHDVFLAYHESICGIDYRSSQASMIAISLAASNRETSV